MSTPPAPETRIPLSRDRIVGAALAVLDADGLAGLTMRRVGRQLDTGAMSLYRHVASREDLLDLVLNELAAGIPASPITGSWREDVAAIARCMRAALLRRRDLTLLLTARLGQGPAGLGLLDHALGVFLGAGFPPWDAVRANQALGNYVAGACTWEAIGLAGASDPADRSDRAAEAAAGLAAVPPDAFPYVAATASELFAGTAGDRFEYGLDLLLDGLAVRLAEVAPGEAGRDPTPAPATTPAPVPEHWASHRGKA